MSITEKEIDIDSLVNTIFSDHPKDECSINLALGSFPSLEELSDVLTYITVMGIKKIFSVNNEKIRLSDMTNDNINLIKRYVRSFGFNLNLEILSIDEISLKIKKENEEKKLSDYIYTIKTKENKFLFSFDHIIKT